ncbi:phospholipid scramblase 2 [Trichomycterus rosablanca]|uniref:phospholipid scramblase 2 n=1 Tax=Trichomycterus rosablanca TaxID=2290929 RepID=UPI002F35E1FE
MSTVKDQPIPFGLEREKHIEMLFRAFHRTCRSSTDPQDLVATPVQRKCLLPGDCSPTSQAAIMEKENGGLALLQTVSQLQITSIPELQGPQCISRKTYSIASETKQQLFVVVEESSCVCMQCCGPARSCSLQGFNQDRQQVFQFERPLRADMCCLGCCLMEMRAYTAQRELIGTVHQRWSMFTPYFEVCDSTGSTHLRIQGSCCPIRCLSNQEFQVVSMIGEHVGRVWKKWPGYNERCNMDHEYFGLDVPQNMLVNMKVLLLAATFLLNNMFFEMS